jgi:hypothetical protein
MRQLVLTTVLFACPSSVGMAVVVSDAVGSHATTPGERAFGVNVDGVVQLAFADGFPVASAALISDRHVLTAAHVIDLNEDGTVDPFVVDELLVYFDLPGGRVAVPVQGAVLPDEWSGFPEGWEDRAGIEWAELHDIAIIELASDAPDVAPRYPLYGGQGEVGQRVVVVGYGATGRGDTGMQFTGLDFPKRAGLNRYEADTGRFATVPNSLLYDFDSGLEENNALALLGVDSDLGFGADEVLAAAGDSGGPVFLGDAIAGVTLAGFGGEDDLPTDATAEADSSWGELSVDIRVSYYRDFITAATGGQARFVIPEPSALEIILIAGVCLFAGPLQRLAALRTLGCTPRASTVFTVPSTTILNAIKET